MKKIFVDIYLAFNLGDDLFLHILSEKFPGCRFTLNYVGKVYDAIISQYQNVGRRKYTFLDKIGQRLKITDTLTNYEAVAADHDALLFIGGSIFREEEYHCSLYKDRMEMISQFKKYTKPIFVLGANFGPFKSEKFYIDYKEFFRLCNDVCFRDQYSYDLFKDLPQVRYAPDIIFQLNVDDYKGLTVNNRVGFSIIDVHHKHGLSNFYEEYMRSTSTTIELLVNKGYECYLMSFCEQEGDLEIIDNIISALPNNIRSNVFTYGYRGNIKEAIKLIGSFNLCVAARFHANILALLLGIGVMPIIYSPKTSNMLRDIGLNDIQISMDNLYLQHDMSTINKSFNNKINLKSVITNAENHFKKIREFIEMNSSVLEEL